MLDDATEVDPSRASFPPAPIRVTSFQVDRLFHLYDHNVPLNLKDRVTVLHGPNGVGKTILLKLIASFFRGHYHEMVRVPFHEIRISMGNGDRAVVRQSREQRKKRSVPKLDIELHRADGSHAESKIVISEEALDRRLSELEHIPWLTRRGPELWLDRQSGEELTPIDAWERYSSLIFSSSGRKMPNLFSEEEWLVAFRAQTSVHYIETHRLVRYGPVLRHRIDLPGQLIPTVRECSSDLQARINHTLQSYGRESQTLDQTFPQRLLRGIDSLSVDAIKAHMKALDSERDKLRTMGLLDERADERFDVATLDRLEGTQQAVMTLYLGDTRKKIDVLASLAKRIELLLSQLNAKLQNKRLSVHPKQGLIAVGHDQSPLPLDSLSSGEQHEIVLLYELLFRVKPNSLVLVDEPELSLHLEWQKKFLPDLIQVVDAVQFDVLLATHSPFIVGDRNDLMIAMKSTLGSSD